MKMTRKIFILLALTLAGCVTQRQEVSSPDDAVMRQTPVFRIEETIHNMIQEDPEWEMAQFRSYRQEDIDGDRIDDTVMLTTFEQGNTWRRDLFVCLSSRPTVVMHRQVGGKGERAVDEVEIVHKEIVLKGKTYGPADPMSSPSVPYVSRYAVVGDRIVEKK